ncbi:conserved hypothetical protein [Talaromyces stipitatus ATCC 10500]|uniref:Uncharacterized protein n=1 Tax=Talaromyces stipitatus (strain ATCC 10500 / CBS 375.48 / QM 6759 / NRRL 1006) TaxID=441959 RepID=B8MKG8_TALSN|nr:uncharacterized protein TSTA_047690 [Talaromyces stipitatus ATCC 10500]EED15323.1 conserved hypothetical protein [Talaromyces stipitatus ATCC 10500]
MTATRTDTKRQPIEPNAAPENFPHEIPGFKWLLVIAAIYSSQFLFALDNITVAKLSWISVSFLIGSAGTDLIWGKFYAQLNAKWTYIVCVAVFEVGSAVCGAALSINAFIIARAICGVSGAGMYIELMTLLSITITIQERPDWMALVVLYQSPYWHRVPPIYLFMFPSDKDPHPGVSFLDRAREIVGLFICSGVLFILLGIQQTYTIFTAVACRIIPIEFFTMPTILILFAATAAGGTTIFVPVYMAPLFFQFTRDDSALESGVRILPFIFVMIVAIIANGAILSKFDLSMSWYLAGGILIVIGAALMYTIYLSTSVSQIYGYTVLIGFGVGHVFSGILLSRPSSAVGFISCAQITGITLSLAIANAVFLDKSREGIKTILPDILASEIEQTIAGARSTLLKSLSPSVKDKVLAIIVDVDAQNNS